MVEAELSGVSSGTEMFLYRGTYPNFKLQKWAQWQEYPVRPGYELVGRVVEASGAKGTLQAALDIMRDRGTVELLGWRTEESSFEFGDLYFKEGTIIATRTIGPDPGIPYSYVRWGYDQSLRLAVDMIADGRLKAGFYEPARFSYKDIKQVYDQIHKEPTSVGLQAILTWK